MLLTEEEATRKWCPLSRVLVITPGGASPPAFNRTLQAEAKQIMAPGTPGEVTLSLPEATQCAASGCMMWRWLDHEKTENNGQRRGFCGLAMNPLTFLH
jgi:hypothetical protein